jgi:hypothetical protein
VQAHRAAQAEYDAVTKPLLAAVHTGPEYLAAYQARREAEIQLSELNKKPNPTEDELVPHIEAIGKNNLLMKQIDEAAIDADPKASKAKEDLAAAKAAVTAMDAEFTAMLRENQEYQAARQEWEDAQKQLREARVQNRPQPTRRNNAGGGFRGGGGGGGFRGGGGLGAGGGMRGGRRY